MLIVAVAQRVPLGGSGAPIQYNLHRSAQDMPAKVLPLCRTQERASTGYGRSSTNPAQGGSACACSGGRRKERGHHRLGAARHHRALQLPAERCLPQHAGEPQGRRVAVAQVL